MLLLVDVNKCASDDGIEDWVQIGGAKHGAAETVVNRCAILEGLVKNNVTFIGVSIEFGVQSVQSKVLSAKLTGCFFFRGNKGAFG